MNSIQLVINQEIHEVTIKEFQDQRVVTLRDMDNLHQRPEGTAGRNFRQNQNYLIEGEDYFRRNSSDAFMDYGLKAPNGLILLTESGYLMLVKSFTDKLAWQVQRQLVNAYFKVKQAHQEQIVPTSTEDIMIYTLQNQKEMKQRIDALETENRKLALIVDNSMYVDDHQKGEIQEAVCTRVGQLMKLGYESHFQSIYRALKAHFTVPKYDKILKKDFPVAMDLIKGWYPKKNEASNE